MKYRLLLPLLFLAACGGSDAVQPDVKGDAPADSSMAADGDTGYSDGPQADAPSADAGVDAGSELQITTVSPHVVAHGSRLEVFGSGFSKTTGLTIGGVSQAFLVTSDSAVVVPIVEEATPLGMQDVVVETSSKSTAPYTVTVVHLVISEIDADQAGVDSAEFVEISTGVADVTLAGYSAVLWNGATDVSYLAINLGGAATDKNGLLVLGNTATSPDITFADGTLQNGADAVTLHQGSPGEFAMDTPLTIDGLIDAVVYGTGDADDVELLAMFLGDGAEAVQLDEDMGGGADTQSVQRCSDVRLDGRSFVAATQTPGETNDCPTASDGASDGGITDAGTVDATTVDGSTTDAAPLPVAVTSVDYPVLAHGARLSILGYGFFSPISVTIGDEPQTFVEISDTSLEIPVLSENTPLGAQQLTVSAADGESAPFPLTVVHLVLSEIDSDQASTDTMEFVEIASGVPDASLAGYVLVFWNGATDTVYHAINLATTADESGLVLLGNTAVVPTPTFTFTNGTLQNGPDALSIHQGLASDFSEGTFVSAAGLLDAVVYDTDDADDVGLLDALLGLGPERVQLNESSTGTLSIQRCDDARLDGRAFDVALPTPGAPNSVACPPPEPDGGIDGGAPDGA